MYAFNKRFRPTLHFGLFSMVTLAAGLFGLLIVIFAVMAAFQIGNKPLGLMLFVAGISALGYAVKDHMNQSRRRLQRSISVGRQDRKQPRLEVGNG